MAKSLQHVKVEEAVIKACRTFSLIPGRVGPKPDRSYWPDYFQILWQGEYAHPGEAVMPRRTPTGAEIDRAMLVHNWIIDSVESEKRRKALFAFGNCRANNRSFEGYCSKRGLTRTYELKLKDQAISKMIEKIPEKLNFLHAENIMESDI